MAAHPIELSHLLSKRLSAHFDRCSSFSSGGPDGQSFNVNIAGVNDLTIDLSYFVTDGKIWIARLRADSTMRSRGKPVQAGGTLWGHHPLEVAMYSKDDFTLIIRRDQATNKFWRVLQDTFEGAKNLGLEFSKPTAALIDLLIAKIDSFENLDDKAAA
jgi:hypothetical protein